MCSLAADWAMRDSKFVCMFRVRTFDQPCVRARGAVGDHGRRGAYAPPVGRASWGRCLAHLGLLVRPPFVCRECEEVHVMRLPRAAAQEVIKFLPYPPAASASRPASTQKLRMANHASVASLVFWHPLKHDMVHLRKQGLQKAPNPIGALPSQTTRTRPTFALTAASWWRRLQG